MTTMKLTRRALLGSSIATAAASTTLAANPSAKGSTFVYEVERSEEEWREMLTADEYEILRNGQTEWPKSSALWEERRDGTYHCRGCDLHVFSANWQVPIDKGWVFFEHSEVDAVLTGIDGPVEQYGQSGMASDAIAMIEIHCRRCGSHLGHYLPVAGQNVHCINGIALTFNPKEA